MKKVLPIVFGVIAFAVLVWAGGRLLILRLDPGIDQFNQDAGNLIKGLQEYRKFVGNYPSGTRVDIAKALSGEATDGDKKFVLIAIGEDRKNDKGEIVDPWGTPVEFFFSHDTALIRSAGPNKIFEDSSKPSADDLYRSEVQAQDN